MRHAVAGYKLNRDTEHRTALFRNLAAALFQHGQIRTTRPKAKAVQPFVEKLITLAKRGDLHARRQAIAKLQDRELVHVVRGGQDVDVEDKTLIQKLFDEIGPRYSDRDGGYTRIVQLAEHRKGDGGDLVILQLVGEEEEGAPRVRGRHSRRRQKQLNRTNFAAKLRKQRSQGGGSQPAQQPEEEQAGGGSEVADEAAAAAEPEQNEAQPGESESSSDSAESDEQNKKDDSQ